ncbi:phage tail protein [Rhodoblastus acidophilus]|uniref:Phage tail protein n=1 Tax=Candidatus Rhodoblastus alkanivorans TaxID=2954117 RepID=A0ABS9Z9H8_9HYPH|nr:phage tail protein [Candidatus Rhodoblastus alkanivorans]MCI4680168.1 phage tail protein [Candidatus Rhodoblastus alkanivorans]MCI4684125.1 phage tail protein [Candidatus Rhodoblastus alkanivorans]MDI4641445.1 phage tail protein [Rhodoblastus acidophilus]
MGRLSSAGNQWTENTIYSGIQIQSTSSAIPVPIVYGRNIVSPNIIWYNGFGAWASVTGKGGQKQWTAHYYADVIMGICEGPISGVGNVWQSSTIPLSLGLMGLTLELGGSPQAVWPYLAAKYPSQALTYPGTAYVYASTFNLGASATINSSNFEVYGILAGSGFNSIDADPAQMIYDFLTNSQYGVGFPPASISGDSLYNSAYGYQNYCKAVGMAFSAVLNAQERAASILTRWLQLSNSTAIWSDGMLKFIPLGDSVVTGNGATFTPNTTALYSLTDEDFVYSQGEDPVQITRSDPYSLPNWQSIEIQGRADNYNTGPVTAFDQSMIDRFGLRLGSTITAHEICDAAMGQTAAQLILQRGLYIRNAYKFKLGEEFCLLEPMDLVQLTDSVLGLNATTVRIMEIDEDEAGVLTVAAEEWPGNVQTSVAYPTQNVSSGAPTASNTPNQVNAPLVIEPPPALTDNASQIWIGVSPQNADPNWGGCVVMASFDGTTYAEVATIYAAAKQGVLSANLPAYSGGNPDTTDTLVVNLTESGATLTSTTAASAAAGVTMCYVGGEYLSFTTATLTAANQYNLTGLYRGQGGVESVGSSAGAPFCLLDSAILKYAIPSAEIGQTIYLKFQSFNIFGGGPQDLSTCTAYAYAVQGTGALGAVATALAVGAAMDFGHVAGDGVSESDDYGTLSGTVTAVIDIGNCTS